jgi:hypothetical protein
MVKERKIIGWLPQELLPNFKNALYMNRFEMELDDHSRENRIYPVPRVRQPGYYPYCAVLEKDGLKFTFENIPDFKNYHKNLEEIFKNVLDLRKKK